MPVRGKMSIACENIAGTPTAAVFAGLTVRDKLTQMKDFAVLVIHTGRRKRRRRFLPKDLPFLSNPVAHMNTVYGILRAFDYTRNRKRKTIRSDIFGWCKTRKRLICTLHLRFSVVRLSADSDIDDNVNDEMWRFRLGHSHSIAVKNGDAFASREWQWQNWTIERKSAPIHELCLTDNVCLCSLCVPCQECARRMRG